MFDHFTSDLLGAHLVLPRFWAPIVADTLSYGIGWVAEVGGVARGFAGWLAPGTYPRGQRRDALMALGLAPALPRIRNRREAAQVLVAMDEHHPEETSWYLSILGVDPELQRRGIGGRLLARGLEAADAEGLPCYLETQREENLAFYGRHGFVQAGRFVIGSAPPMRLVRRPPA